MKWYTKAAKQGDVDGVFNLGAVYLNGKGVPKNEKEAFKWITKAAEQGDSEAQNVLGGMYYSGLGVGANENEAFKWWEKSSEQGNANSQFNLGVSYRNGVGVAKDDKKSFDWFTKSAEQGDADGQFNLGLSYRDGVGVAKDKKKAFDWFTKAGLQGNVGAQSNLGWCYRDGIGVTKDEKKAFEWFTKSANQGDADAQYHLGWCYQRGIGVTKDEKKAFDLYSKSAEQGDKNGQNKMGWCYRNGIGVEKDDKKAFEWFTKAALQGDADAQGILGYCYESAVGVNKDEKEAVKWYRTSAEQGDAYGQYHLGYMLANGLSAKKNLNEAKEWYQKAAKGNCGNAQYALGNLYFSENKFTKAKSLYEKAKKNNIILASEALLMAKKNISQEGPFRGISNLKWWGVLILIVTLLSYLSGWIFVFGVFENTNQAKVIAFILGVFGIFNLFIAPLIFIKMLKVFENPRMLIFYGLPVALFLSGWLNAFSKKQIFKRLSYLFFLLGGFVLSALIAILLYLIGNIFLDVFHGPSLFQCFFLTAVFSFGVLGMVRIGKKEESIQTWKNLCMLASISGFVCAVSAAFFLNEYYLSAESSKTDKLVYCLIHVLLPTGLVISWKHLNPTVRKASYLLCCIWVALISFRILQLVSIERYAKSYLEALSLIQKGEELSKDKNLQKAKVAFQSASEIITNIAKQKPDWETELVNYRRDDLSKKILALDSESATNPQQTP
jgi:TPR repeat protein